MQSNQNFVQIKEISEKLDISFHFLTKILQILSQNGLILSFKGPKGGVKLAKQPSEIFLFDVVITLDGPDIFEECILGLPGCNRLEPCPMHSAWSLQRESIKDNFKQTSFAYLADKIRKEQLRLTHIS